MSDQLNPAPSSPGPSGRVASPADQTVAVATLAEAFQNEPAFSFILPDPVARRRALIRAFRIIFEADSRAGAIMMTAGGEAVTAWRSPDQMRAGPWETLRTGLPYLHAFGPAIGRALQVSSLIQAHLPPEGCWYLHYAGCHSAHRGKGFGGAAIRAGIARADAQGMRCWLETADPANLAIYRALGFAEVSTWQVPGGPQFWGMMRPAR